MLAAGFCHLFEILSGNIRIDVSFRVFHALGNAGSFQRANLERSTLRIAFVVHDTGMD